MPASTSAAIKRSNQNATRAINATVAGSDEAMFRRYNRWHARFCPASPRTAAWAIKDLASAAYINGIFAWRSSNYQDAAEYWYRSFHLDPNRNDAIYWYKRAREKTTPAASD